MQQHLADTRCIERISCVNILPDWQLVKKRYGDRTPLNVKQRTVIDYNRPKLVKLIDPDSGFVQHLFNSDHKNHVECGMNKLDKGGRLLDIMRRRSVADYNKLVDALHAAGQPHLAQMLKEGGGKFIKEK